MENFELEHQGLIDGDIVSELDYKMGASNPLEIPQNDNKNNYFYNQGKIDRHRNACVLYANAACLGYLMNYKFTTEEISEIVDLAEKNYEWIESEGMYISKGADCVRTWWNLKYPDRKVKTFRMTVGDTDFAEALKKNHRLVVGYRTSKLYHKDAQDNGIVDGDTFTDHNGGHCVSSLFGVAEVISTKEGILIQDNYTGSKAFNIYYNNKIAKLKETGTFFESAFIYLKEETMSETIRKNIDLEKAKEAFDKGYWNGLNPREPMSRQEVMTVLMRIVENKGE